MRLYRGQSVGQFLTPRVVNSGRTEKQGQEKCCLVVDRTRSVLLLWQMFGADHFSQGVFVGSSEAPCQPFTGSSLPANRCLFVLGASQGSLHSP